MTTISSSIDDHSRTIIHIDIDCFYAQVEIIKNPNLRTVPLGIQQKNIVVTSNYIAREYGIKKCMLISEARKLCPNLVLVNGEDLHDYRQLSYKVTELLQNYSTLVERLGLDENYIDVTNLVNERLSQRQHLVNRTVVGNVFGDLSELCDCGCTERLNIGTNIAQEVRELIKTSLNLTSCAGIAHNKLLAKLAGSKHKPNQQTVVYPNNALELMLSLDKAGSIPGIGAALVEQLKTLNINSVEELQNANLQQLCSVVGEEKGKLLYNLSYGIDKSLVKSSGKPQSIGIEDSCKPITVEAEIRDKLKHLLYRLLVLVEEDGRTPKTIKLTVRKFDKNTKTSHRETRQCNVSSSLFNLTNISRLSSASEAKLLKMIMYLFTKSVNTTKPYHITLLGLSFTKFTDRSDNKNTLASFLKKKNLEVQSITNIENVTSSTSTMPPTPMPSTSFTHSDNSDSPDEPNMKKSKFSDLLMKRCSIDSVESEKDDCASPCKLRVAELRLTSIEKSAETTECPPDVKEEVFRELPNDVQKELWEDYKQEQRDKNRNVSTQMKKSKPNSILNYFVRT